MTFLLRPGTLTLNDIKKLIDSDTKLQLDSQAHEKIHQSEKVVRDIIADHKTVYGINTGFGLLANTHIKASELETLQRSIVLSHAAGVGELLDNKIVKLILLLKINSLARGFSGVRLTTIERLITLYNEEIYPSIPCQGSVGASGDLAPLAHLSAALIGVGNVSYRDKIITAEAALHELNLQPITLAAKEGLALLNGTQASTALALIALIDAHNVFKAALITGAMSIDATLGSITPFDARIHEVRGLPEQIHVANILRNLLSGSGINASHEGCEKVQDPYSLRCQPQVMGACLAHLRFAEKTLVIEANAVSDNPLVFAEQGEILSGGNFHAEPVAMASDTMALSIAEIGALSERRMALLTDPRFSSLPAFLVNEPGINSGFMIAQVTAAALASENKCLAHPASVDSLPTSANQEDHVSMATYAARRLLAMVENTANIVAIEMLAACQGVDFRRPLQSSDKLELVHALVRERVVFYDKDRFFAPDISAIKTLITTIDWHQFL